MTSGTEPPVRPTRRALADLGLTFPPLSTPLHTLNSPVIRKAQRIPQVVEAGHGERILSLTDRVWFKVKVDDDRGAVTHLHAPDGAAPDSEWWLGAAGRRRGNSSSDFYTRLHGECERLGKGSGEVKTDHLLPQRVDRQRQLAEDAAIVVATIQTTVREAIAGSAQDGDMWRVSAAGHAIGALVRSADGDTYLAITADGYYDPKIVAVILDSVPGIQPEQWQAEPSAVLGIVPTSGQVIFSTMIPPASLASLLTGLDTFATDAQTGPEPRS